MHVYVWCVQLWNGLSTVGMLLIIVSQYITVRTGMDKEMTKAQRLEWFLCDQKDGLFAAANKNMQGGPYPRAHPVVSAPTAQRKAFRYPVLARTAN
jgi:hypothetical protein